MILNDNQQPFKITQSLESLDEAYNSNWMKNIRKSMLNNEEVAICQRCYTEESAGLISARQSWNEKYLASVKQEVAETKADGACHFKPIYIDLRLGNLCNLKCRMCNPYASQKWLEDWDKIKSLEKISEQEARRLGAMDWFKDERLLQNMLSALDSVEEIYFTGGEPLLIKKHFELLQMIKANGGAPRVSLKYNTNLTYIPDKVFNLWNGFKKVTVNVSLDGVGRVNEYIRHPSDWFELEKNLMVLDQFASSHSWMNCSIHTTLQLYNLEHLIDVLDYTLGLNAFHKLPYVNILNHPRYLNIKNAPQDLKKQVARDLDQWFLQNIDKIKDQPHAQKVLGLVDYMMQDDYRDLETFKLYTQELDLLRKESLEDVCPRLFSSLSLHETRIFS